MFQVWYRIHSFSISFGRGKLKFPAPTIFHFKKVVEHMLSPLSRSIIFQTVFDLKRVSIDKHEINLGNVCAPPSEWKWQAVRAWKRRLSVTSDKFDSLNKWTSAELMVQPHCNVENGMCGTEFPFVINFLGFFVVVEKCCGYQFHVERIKWILRDGNSKHVCNFLSLFDVCVCVCFRCFLFGIMGSWNDSAQYRPNWMLTNSGNANRIHRCLMCAI